jgi:4,5-dihydroxyphthalate decarboxylase
MNSGKTPETLAVTLTCASYARLLPLVAGQVSVPGLALTLLTGEAGSWPARAEMLRRALADNTVQGGEASCAQHLYRIDRGDRSHVGLPVFPLRNFTARDLYVREGGAVHGVADLAGKRVGMYSYTASGSVWYRHFLRFMGVDPATITWMVGNIDTSSAGTAPPDLPPGVLAAPGGRPLSELLVGGEIDALFSPPRPARYHPTRGAIRRLLPDFPAIERDYFARTGAFPPQHLIVIRRELWEAHRWTAKAITEAFIHADRLFDAAQRGFPYATPWLEAELEATEATVGDNFSHHGLEANRANIEMFCEEAHLLGLTRRRIGVDEYFAEFLAS